MSSFSSGVPSPSGLAAPQPAPLLKRLARLFEITRRSGTADDPIYLSALDETTLGRFGYSHAQINLIKESTFR
jgi:hypothetical protein